MAVITSAASGNFSSPTTWVGGIVPGPLDNAKAAAGHTVTINVNATVIDIQGQSTGKFIMGEGVTLTGNVLGNTVSGNFTLDVSITTFCHVIGNMVTFVVDTTYCARMTGSGTLNVQGNIGGGTAGANRRGLLISSGVVNVIGNIVLQVNSGVITLNAIQITGDCTLNVTGNLFCTAGGTNAGSPNIICTGTNVNINIIGNLENVFGSCISGSGSFNIVTVIGNVLPSITTSSSSSPNISLSGTNSEIHVIGNVYGGQVGSGLLTSGTNSLINIEGDIYANDIVTLPSTSAVRNLSTIVGRGVILKGSMFYGDNGATPILTNLMRMIPVTNSKTVYTKTDSTIYTHAALTAVDFNIPFEEDVRQGIVYGDDTYTGTLVVPSPSNVRKGVPTDNTVGTADLTAADMWDYLASNITTAGSIGKLVKDNLDVAVSTRLASASYVAPDNANIAAIKAVTDTLTDVATETTSLLIKDKTNLIPNNPASVESVGAIVASYNI